MFTCVGCGVEFTRKPNSWKRGVTPRYCTVGCYRARGGTPEERAERRRTYVREFMRKRRRGENVARAKRPDGSGSYTDLGYHIVYAPGHPLARKQGTVLSHRKELYDRTGPGLHPCHWCGDAVSWDIVHPKPGALVVDHVDADKTNNEPANLVPSCRECNNAPAKLKRVIIDLRAA